MKTHKKTKIEILIEAVFEEKLIAILEDMDVGGYTIYPVISGKGDGGHWSRRGLVNDVGQMLLFSVIVDKKRGGKIAEKVHASIADYQGVITLSEVEVFRAEKF